MRKFILSSCLILIFLISAACQKQKSGWQGTIEEENGVKIVKNPENPLFGEILLELEEDLSIGREGDENYQFYEVVDIALDSQGNIYVLDSRSCHIKKFDSVGLYLQTIGKKGQGPGEFERPGRIALDPQGNIFIADGGGRRMGSRMMKIFDSQGEFIKSIRLESPIVEFSLSSDGNIFALGSKREEGETLEAIIKMNPEGKILHTMAEFSFVRDVIKSTREMTTTFRARHYYTPKLIFSSLNGQTFSYAQSLEYEISIADASGKALLKMQKKESSHPITREEKDFVMEELEKSISRTGTSWPKEVLEDACQFPPTRPFFYGIFADDLQRLYVWRLKPLLVARKDKNKEFDIFNKKGYYIYRAKIPVTPKIIQDGFLYEIQENEETGEVCIKKYRIRNWAQMKTAI